jgi:hypothetical protein
VARLFYLQQHVLETDGERWEINAESRLRKLEPDTRISFTLELSSLAADWQDAIARARRWDAALIDGIGARIQLSTVSLYFLTTEPTGEAKFWADLDHPSPFPRSLDNTELVEALALGSREAGDWRIQADEIEETERYWIFPTRGIGMLGVAVDRTTRRAFGMGSALTRSTWIWAYEHGLLDEPVGDLVVETVIDPDRAFEALCQFADVRREDLERLPLVLEDCADWRAAAPLEAADDALRWSVTSPSARRS